jgi:hypothetical protein
MRRCGFGLFTGALLIGMAAVPAGAAEGNAKKFCKTNLAIDKAFDAEQPKARVINRLLDAAIRTAPSEIADAVDVAVPALKRNPEEAFDDPAVVEAVGEIETFEYENCGYEQVEVTLEDYAFTGLPSELEKGITAFRLDNTGVEAHELFVMRLKGDTTLDEVIQADEDALDDLGQAVGGGFAEPGQESYTTMTIRSPGRYAAVCFVKVGTTSEAEGTGPTHASEGMATEFGVS